MAHSECTIKSANTASSRVILGMAIIKTIPNQIQVKMSRQTQFNTDRYLVVHINPNNLKYQA